VVENPGYFNQPVVCYGAPSDVQGRLAVE